MKNGFFNESLSKSFKENYFI